MAIMINGRDLTVEEVIKVCRQGEQVAITEEAQRAVKKARDYVDKKLEDGAIIYGLTTGFGKFSDVFISHDETADLQRNLIISHTCALGNALPTPVVRGIMLLRCNALSRGNSGIRPGTLNTLLEMLNKGVHPQIPEKGSLGASGDLAPLSHMVLTLIGEGEAEYQGKVKLYQIVAPSRVQVSTYEQLK
ncbi:MAG: aromatic amino acid lyase, partial [Clostridiales bacterium]|nr:aromatic amino acid lyase [Clostridiales bacterium]